MQAMERRELVAEPDKKSYAKSPNAAVFFSQLESYHPPRIECASYYYPFKITCCKKGRLPRKVTLQTNLHCQTHERYMFNLSDWAQ